MSKDGMSGGHALRQCQEKVDNSLVLTGGDEVEGLLVAEVGVGRPHPESGCIVVHDSPGKVNHGPELKEALFRVTARGGGLCLPSSDASRVGIGHTRKVSGVHNIAVVEVVQQ